MIQNQILTFLQMYEGSSKTLHLVDMVLAPRHILAFAFADTAVAKFRDSAFMMKQQNERDS